MLIARARFPDPLMPSAPLVEVTSPTSANDRPLMKQVRRQDTAPELAVRRYPHALGPRFRLHGTDLPSRPGHRALRSVVASSSCVAASGTVTHAGTARSRQETTRPTGPASSTTTAPETCRQQRAPHAAGRRVEVVWGVRWRAAPIAHRLALKYFALTFRRAAPADRRGRSVEADLGAHRAARSARALSASRCACGAHHPLGDERGRR